MKNLLSLITLLLLFQPSFGQDSVEEELEVNKTVDYSNFVYESWAGTRVLNNHSTEMLPWRNLEFIVAHKFGDIAGDAGGVYNFYGLDNVADVRIAFEYGFRDNINVGLGRSKGVGVTTQVIDSYFKYRVLRQEVEGMPLSLTYVGSAVLPYKRADLDSSSAGSYQKFTHRLGFTNQLLIGRKFHERFTAQLNVGVNHRNYVADLDENTLFFAGASGRFRINKWLGIVGEYNHVFNRPVEMVHTNSLSFGIELLTGGHNFTLIFSNSKGLNENIFLNQTTSNWLDGQFRFGFSINRRFKL
ncbi:MAG: DUF5777 family beta-barrel protein [Crocinitomicaceae bacterium]|nr:DUF5777 family beta-barrel protein [Crocinitomicaceae bacterium]